MVGVVDRARGRRLADRGLIMAGALRRWEQDAAERARADADLKAWLEECERAANTPTPEPTSPVAADPEPVAAGGDRPNTSDPKSVWVEYAGGLGVDVEGLTKTEIQDAVAELGPLA